MMLIKQVFLGLNQNGKIDLYYILKFKLMPQPVVGNQLYHIQYRLNIHVIIDLPEIVVKKKGNSLQVHFVKTVIGIQKLDLQ